MRTDDTVEAVRQCFVKDLSASTCRRSTQSGMAKTSLQTILKLDIKIFPCKIQIVQTLQHEDTQHVFVKVIFVLYHRIFQCFHPIEIWTNQH